MASRLDVWDGTGYGEHEVGFTTRGLFHRKYRLFCETCGLTGEWDDQISSVKARVAIHLRETRSRGSWMHD